MKLQQVLPSGIRVMKMEGKDVKKSAFRNVEHGGISAGVAS